jgi:DNA repair exonuclease SbcCD ATPase subunit
MYRSNPVLELNDRILELEEQVGKRRRLEQRIGHIESEKLETAARIAEFKKTLQRADARTTALVKKSLRRFLHELLGNLDNQLDKRRTELASTQLKLSSAEVELQELEREEDALRARLAEYTDVERSRANLLRQMLSVLNSNPASFELLDPRVRRLFDRHEPDQSRWDEPIEIHFGVTEDKDMATELAEAIDAARAAAAALASLASDIDRVLRSSDDLEYVTASVARAQLALQGFTREAVDVYVLAPMAERIDERIADELVADLVADSSGAGQDSAAMRCVRDAEEQIARYLQGFRRRLQTLAGK